MLQFRVQLVTTVILLMPIAACSKPIPGEVGPLVDSAAMHTLIASARESAACQQDYGIGAIYIAALSVVNRSGSPSKDLNTFEAQLRDVSMDGRDGPWKPCEHLQLYRELVLRPVAQILVAGDRKEEASLILSELSKSDLQKDFVAELYAMLGERGRAQELVSQIAEKDRTKALLKVAIALLNRGDLAGSQQMLTGVSDSAARSSVESVVTAAQGKWSEAWKLSQTAPAEVQDDIQGFFAGLFTEDTCNRGALEVAKAILSTKRDSCDRRLVSCLVNSGETQEAMQFVGPSVKEATQRLSCMAIIAPALLKSGRQDQLASLVAQATTLGGRHTDVAVAGVLRRAGREAEADAVISKAVAGTDQPNGTDLSDRFQRFLNKTSLAGALREAGVITLIPDLLKGAESLAADPGRCNMLTGISSHYAAIGRFADAARVVKDCTAKGNQAWRVFAHALALIEYARQSDKSFGVRLTRTDQATLGAWFQLNSVFGVAY